jgi:hypothetical protein
MCVCFGLVNIYVMYLQFVEARIIYASEQLVVLLHSFYQSHSIKLGVNNCHRETLENAVFISRYGKCPRYVVHIFVIIMVIGYDSSVVRNFICTGCPTDGNPNHMSVTVRNNNNPPSQKQVTTSTTTNFHHIPHHFAIAIKTTTNRLTIDCESKVVWKIH